ncbi:phosphoglycolate phosphatase [Pseudoalteromonas ulvae UL12]|uniref:Haloacid dehalogenase n=1 Tax=Pseudoalteromonas ulvae TaxID=107327 RepID=A0A244CMN7_PSEDV|nr:HAD-IA family hydrolase [Pseudoalteromonas ulvae]MBE0364046.1 phosphoglycolate phosphatase [Pseudoalteromonas ulvae UL12]OUL56818.1 haloacid dehalogenase [Pseudoalteromonas ulvae]
MAISSILFDLDGTLLDTADDLGAALNHVLAKYQFKPLTADEYKQHASNGSVALLKAGFGEHWDTLPQANLKTEFLDYYQNNIAVYTRYYPSIERLLQTLNEQGIPWGIVTNKPTYLTLPLLTHFALLKESVSVVCGDTLTVAKPSAEPILLACEQIGIIADKCLYLGDAQRDIEAGQNAGMKTAIASWGYIPKNLDLSTWNADLVFTDAQQLINHI